MKVASFGYFLNIMCQAVTAFWSEHRSGIARSVETGRCKEAGWGAWNWRERKHGHLRAKADNTVMVVQISGMRQQSLIVEIFSWETGLARARW